jgi:hypothetical protein
MTIADDLHALADRLARLAPSHRNPDHYFEEKSEIVAELRRLANSERKPFIIAANDNRPALNAKMRRGPQGLHGI